MTRFLYVVRKISGPTNQSRWVQKYPLIMSPAYIITINYFAAVIKGLTRYAVTSDIDIVTRLANAIARGAHFVDVTSCLAEHIIDTFVWKIVKFK